jgi:hypothetical protein
VAASFQLELEHLISREAPRSIILSSVAGTDVPSLHAFLKVLSRNGQSMTSITSTTTPLPRMCYHINGDDLAKEVLRLTPLD